MATESAKVTTEFFTQLMILKKQYLFFVSAIEEMFTAEDNYQFNPNSANQLHNPGLEPFRNWTPAFAGVTSKIDNKKPGPFWGPGFRQANLIKGFCLRG